MDLYAGNTYWNQTQSATSKFEKLKQDIHTDVLIVGAGMSGTLCAHVLSTRGLDTVVVEKDSVAYGSSVANTGMLQYCSDKSISEFAEDIGEEKAVLFYQMCLEAMDQLTELNRQLEGPTGYRLRDSINYASEEKDQERLMKDQKLFDKYGFPSEFLNRQELKERYQIDKAAALRTWHDAEVNPYQFIQSITKKNSEQGVTYYENTEVDLDQITTNSVQTVDGFVIHFNHLILGTGYTTVYPAIQDKCIQSRTYAFASAPIKGELWKDEAMVWETKRPYLYFRTTPDHRVIAGGRDEEINQVVENPDKIRQINEEIAEEIETLFPHLNIDIEYVWNALFYGSKDGLPFIGADPSQPNKYFLLGYEGNGTCYSMAGAVLLADLIEGKENPYQNLLRIDR